LPVFFIIIVAIFGTLDAPSIVAIAVGGVFTIITFNSL
jgi:hypothetical protein